jgi:hypothetical protein
MITSGTYNKNGTYCSRCKERITKKDLSGLFGGPYWRAPVQGFLHFKCFKESLQRSEPTVAKLVKKTKTDPEAAKLATVIAILSRMGTKPKKVEKVKDDLDGLKALLESQMEAGIEIEDGVSKDESLILSDLGYDIAVETRGKKDKPKKQERPTEATGRVPRGAALKFFKDFVDSKGTFKRDEIISAFTEQFGKDKVGGLFNYIQKATTDSILLGFVLDKEKVKGEGITYSVPGKNAKKAAPVATEDDDDDGEHKPKKTKKAKKKTHEEEE